MNDENIKIELTGNPFVDTGLCVIASLAKLTDINQLTLAHVKSVYGDGAQLVEWNSKLKSFTQIFGTNNTLYRYSLGFKKGIGPSDKNKLAYKKTLDGLLSVIGKPSHGPRCWSCGNHSDFNFAVVSKNAVESVGKEASDEKYLGRDWFPLAGSLGSDAQALPAASLPPHICPKCLFAIHYLPLGLISLEGKLSVVQCTSTKYWYDFIGDIVDETRGRVQSGKYETLGTKESKSETIIKRLLIWFKRLQNEKDLFSTNLNMFIWRFSNSGASADCSFEEIPNPALVFLWNATRANLGIEIESLLRDEKVLKNSLYQCILTNRDYPFLYPLGRRKGVSSKLFNMYQIEICGHSSRALRIAQKLADGAVKEADDKELKRIQRPEAFKEVKIRNQFRAAMIEMAEKGEFTLDDYLNLFPMKGNGVSVEWDGWNLIRFYLHRLNENNINEERINKNVIPSRVEYTAGVIYNHYLNEKGSDRFKREVLGKMRLGKISNSWLANEFVKLSEMNEGFNYESWSQLCTDEDMIYIKELLFQMRLLWTQWMFENRSSVTLSIPKHDISNNGLPEHAENLLKTMFDDYINRKGLERFHRDILLRFHRGELGLYWFKKKLTASTLDGMMPYTDEEWEELLTDDEGRDIKFKRLFQLRLALSNMYRSKLIGA